MFARIKNIMDQITAPFPRLECSLVNAHARIGLGMSMGVVLHATSILMRMRIMTGSNRNWSNSVRGSMQEIITILGTLRY